MVRWLWRTIRFSVPGQLIWESLAKARRLFDNSPVGHLFYKLPFIARIAIVAVPLLSIIAAPVVYYYETRVVKARGMVRVIRPGNSITFLEGWTIVSLDAVELQFLPSVAKDEDELTKRIKPLDAKTTITFHKDPRDRERTDKILLKLKPGAKLQVSNYVSGQVASGESSPKRFEIHSADENEMPEQ